MALSKAWVPDSALGVEKCVTILAGAKRQLQNPEVSVNLEDGIVSERTTQLTELSSTGAGDDLLDALLGIGDTVRCLREKSFVVVLVPVENEIDAALIENSPQSLHIRRRAVNPGAEKRAVKVRNRA